MEKAHECWVCLEAADPDGAAAAPTGCACRGSAGHAHLSCLVAAAQHGANEAAQHEAWRICPTCKQDYLGPMSVKLARARWELHRGCPKQDSKRGNALGHLALSLQNTHEYTEARPLYEEHLLGLQRSDGNKALVTMSCMVNLAAVCAAMGDRAAALPLLEEVLPACQHNPELVQLTIHCMSLLTKIYDETYQFAAARSMGEAMLKAAREAGVGLHAMANIQAISTLGTLLAKIGDMQAGSELHREGLSYANRVLGSAHPLTRSVVNQAGCSRGLPADLLAFGTVLGLKARPELNDACAWVVGFGDGRYRVRLGNADDTLGIKPAKLVRVPGLQRVVSITFSLSLARRGDMNTTYKPD